MRIDENLPQRLDPALASLGRDVDQSYARDSKVPRIRSSGPRYRQPSVF
jgi:hypothetical protein